MRKFFIKNDNIKDNNIEIIGSDVNHIKNVLRLKIDDKIQICNQDTSQNYIGKIFAIDNTSVKLEILEKIDSEMEGNVELHIFQGLPKADKMELIIQKGTELGVSKLIPVSLKRCIVKLTEKDLHKKLERWQKIAEVAAKQSKRDVVPQIENIIDIKQLCQLVKEYDIFLVAYEDEHKNYIKNELQKLKDIKKNLKIAVLVGPEGGLEEQEVEQLKQSGAKSISLGKRILRTETVALQVSSIIMYELENN